MKNILTSIQSIFMSVESRLTRKAIDMAKRVKKEFAILEQTIKEGGYVVEDHVRTAKDRDDFLQDNTETRIDQNIGRNKDVERARWLMLGVVVMCLIFSVKSVSFLFGSLYSVSSLWVIVPIALLLATFIVIGSIYLNHFADQFREKNFMQYLLCKSAAYIIILFLPLMNLIEGYDSQYSEAVMILNAFICFIDVVAHTALVTMSTVFIMAEDTGRAIKQLRKKDKALYAADLKLRALNARFIRVKNQFSDEATSFVRVIKNLEEINNKAAEMVMLELSNFHIWMINNRVFQHAVLKHHTDAEGRLIVEPKWVEASNDGIRIGFDQLSRLQGYSDASQASVKAQILPGGDDTGVNAPSQPRDIPASQNPSQTEAPTGQAGGEQDGQDDEPSVKSGGSGIPEYEDVFQNDKFL